MNTTALAAAIADHWDAGIVAQLVDYVRIPAKSPHFDPDWEKHGHIERVVQLAHAWARDQSVRGLTLEIVRLPGRTPLLFFEVPATEPDAGDRTVLLYGHLDKQPEMTGWRAGFGPWTPMVEDGKLYGRGGADDGYAVFASLAAIAALQAQGTGPRAVRRADRNLRGERQLRSARVPRRTRIAARARRFRRGSRLGLRRLRTAVGDHVAARTRGRHAHAWKC